MTSRQRKIKWALYYQENRERLLAHQRERYRRDPEHRARKIEQAKQRYRTLRRPPPDAPISPAKAP